MFVTNLKPRELATQTYVQTQVNLAIPTGTVQEINAGHGLSITGGLGSITTTGTIRLLADIGDLTDVSINTPVADQVLTWDIGTSTWMPKTFVGSGTSALVWDDIGNAQTLSGQAHKILKVNAASDEIQFVTNQLVYAPDIISGVGITHTFQGGDNGAVLRLDTDLSEIYTTNVSTADTTIVIVDENGNQRRIRSANFGLDTLYNPITNPFLRSEGISVVSPVTYDSASATFGLNDERYKINFIEAESFGIVGVLPIESGGTSASTEEDARDNLGLAYNEDIMTYNDPEFIGTMQGTDILIRPYYLADGLSIDNQATGYSGGIAVLNTDGEFITVTLTTGAGGEILTATPSGGNYNYQDFLDWNSSPQTGYISQGANIDATVTYQARTGYINFGQTTGESGYGIGYDGKFWFREKGQDWLNTIPFTLQNATNVIDTPNPDDGSILIYDGTRFNFYTVNGDMSMTNYGTMSITASSIQPTSIAASSDGLTVEINQYEFGTLTGLNTGSTIQEQLNTGISINPSNQGDIIYRGDDRWYALNYEPASDKVLCSIGLSIPSWDYVSETFFADDNYVSGDGIVYVSSDGVSGALYTDMSTILTQHSGVSGGIELVNGILSTDLSQLPEVTAFNIDDYSMVVNDLSDGTALDRRIGVSNFISNFAGDGLSFSGGQLTLDTDSDIIPFADNQYDLGSDSNRWAETYTYRLFLHPYATTGAAGSGSQIGEMIYVSNAGSPLLAVWNGSVWKTTSLT